MVGHSPKVDVTGRSDSSDQSLDAVFDLLTNQRRRNVLACLADHTQAIALADLAEDVAVREFQGPITEVLKGEVQEIRILLHHHHLPKLVEAGAVDYDQDRALVRLLESADLVERVLSIAEDSSEER